MNKSIDEAIEYEIISRDSRPAMKATFTVTAIVQMRSVTGEGREIYREYLKYMISDYLSNKIEFPSYVVKEGG